MPTASSGFVVASSLISGGSCVPSQTTIRKSTVGTDTVAFLDVIGWTPGNPNMSSSHVKVFSIKSTTLYFQLTSSDSPPNTINTIQEPEDRIDTQSPGP